MRYRTIFLAGLAVGFVLGARAGRERYEQIARLARKTADSPAFQQAAATAQAQAAGIARAAKDRMSDRVPRMANAAKSKASGYMPGGHRANNDGGPSTDGHPHLPPHERHRNT